MNGVKIQEKRAELGWSQSELGRRLGVSPQHISKWENNHVAISPHYERELNELFVEVGIAPDEETTIVGETATGRPITAAEERMAIDAQDEADIASQELLNEEANSKSNQSLDTTRINVDPPWEKTWDDLIHTELVKDTTAEMQKKVDFDFNAFWDASGLNLKKMSKKDKAKLTDELLGQSMDQIETALGDALSGPSGAKLKDLLNKAVQKGDKAVRQQSKLREEYDGAKKSIISKSQKKVMEQTREINRLTTEAKLLADNAALQAQINKMNSEKMDTMSATIRSLENANKSLAAQLSDIQQGLDENRELIDENREETESRLDDHESRIPEGDTDDPRYQ